MRLTFDLRNDVVLTVYRPPGQWLMSPTPVSFWASVGELDARLRDELDAGLPTETAEPDSVIRRIVIEILGDRRVDQPAIRLAHRGESEMEALQRLLSFDRDTNDNH